MNEPENILNAAKIIFKKAKNLENIKRGYSHEIYSVETGEYPPKVIIKLSNNAPPENSLKKEIRINKLLEKKGFPVPKIILHDESKKIVPFEFVIMTYLEGENLDSIFDKLHNTEKEDIFEQLGDLMGRIHGIKFDKFGELLPEGILERGAFSLKQVGDSHSVNPAVFDHLAETFEFIGYLSSYDLVNKNFINYLVSYLLKNKELIKTTEPPSMIHGDFFNNNFKVKKIEGKWSITGMFDFEFSSSKLREYDFIKLCRLGFMEDGFIRSALLKGYKKYQTIDKNFDERVNFFRIGRDLGFAVFLLKSGNKDLAMKTLNSIKDGTGYKEEIFIQSF